MRTLTEYIQKSILKDIENDKESDMKKLTGIILILLLSLTSILFVTACGDDMPQPKEFTITYSASEGGSITGDTAQTVTEGNDGTPVTAIAHAGYIFTAWSDGFGEASRTETDVRKDMSLTANFVAIVPTYKIRYEATEGGFLSGESTQFVNHGKDGSEIVAIPYKGYLFTEWSDGSKDPVRQEKDVRENRNLTARFEFAFASGVGTKADPFLIESYLHLLHMRYYPSDYYRLTNDLDLAGVNHMPIFDEDVPFGGIFDGGGKTIGNMTVDAYTSLPSLFGYIDYTATVKDLTMTNVDIAVPNYDTQSGTNFCRAGALAGVSLGVLENISVAGKIHCDGLYYDGIAIGGLCGQADKLVKNCRADMRLNLKDI